MSELVEKRNQLDELNAKLKRIKEQAQDSEGNFSVKNITELEGDTTAKKVKAYEDLKEKIKNLDEEVNALAKMQGDMSNTKMTHNTNTEPDGGKKANKSFGEVFINSKAFQNKGMSELLDVNLKTLFETSAGWEPEDLRSGRLVEQAVRPIQIMDIVPMNSTNQTAIKYMEETLFTNNAVETAEAGTYAESALKVTEKTVPVQKVGTFIPVTDEQLADVNQVRGYINNRLRFFLRQRLDGQIVNGDGTGSNLTGILNASGLLSEAVGTGEITNAIHQAITKVQVTGQAMPSHVLMHPQDWQKLRLTVDNNGNYLWGPPSEAGTPRIWGLPVVLAQAMPIGTALVGDFNNFVELSERAGIEVQVSNSHSDYFINGKQAVRADMRVALPIYRPAAYCQVTGL